MNEYNFYKNKEGEIIYTNKKDNLSLVKSNSVDASFEKHVPVYKIEDGKLVVRVGEIDHPMINEHYIMWIALTYEDKIEKIDLKPGEKPTAIFDYIKGSKIYAYCNLHGLWVKDIK